MIQYPLNKLLNIKLPKGELSPEGIILIQDLIRTETQGDYTRNLPTDFSWKWLVQTKAEGLLNDTYVSNLSGERALTLVGTLTKRIASYYYKTMKIKLSNHLLMQIGNIARKHCSDINEVWFDFTDKINWAPGDFADARSCYFTHPDPRNETKRLNALFELGPIAMRTFRRLAPLEPSPEYNVYPGFVGVGRCWVLHTTRIEEKATPVLFNGYQSGNETLFFARVFSLWSGRIYNKIYMSIDEEDSGLIFINGGRGYAQTSIPLTGKELTCRWNFTTLDCKETSLMVRGISKYLPYTKTIRCRSCQKETPFSRTEFQNQFQYIGPFRNVCNDEKCFKECSCCRHCVLPNGLIEVPLSFKGEVIQICVECKNNNEFRCDFCDVMVTEIRPMVLTNKIKEPLTSASRLSFKACSLCANTRKVDLFKCFICHDYIYINNLSDEEKTIARLYQTQCYCLRAKYIFRNCESSSTLRQYQWQNKTIIKNPVQSMDAIKSAPLPTINYEDFVKLTIMQEARLRPSGTSSAAPFTPANNIFRVRREEPF